MNVKPNSVNISL